ncbi:MAG: metallophosphoesterase [Chloroflexi bacterium]|nr:metallophosphoesterase [Chloroflexota bacterium]
MIRVAAIADLHFKDDSSGKFRPWLASLHEDADVLLLGGDLTGIGYVHQARLLADELRGLQIPIFAVLGNHDYNYGRTKEIVSVLSEVGVFVLDGHSATIQVRGQTVGIAGAKGFAGGFGRAVLMPFGEKSLKRFVAEADKEVQKLDYALSKLGGADFKIVVLHYSPVRETLRGELPEIYPFLGCSKLCDPIRKWGVDFVIHGHSHHGCEKGQIDSAIPVRNVSLTVLKRYYAIYELRSLWFGEETSSPSSLPQCAVEEKSSAKLRRC